MACAMVLVAALLVGSVEAQVVGSAAADAPDIELSVYGSGSFAEGVAIGEAGYTSEAGFNRVLVSGAKSELAFHDRDEAACKPEKRWNLYATEKTLRSHRPGGKGGFVISETQSRFLQDLNIGGTIDMKTITIKGSGPFDADSSEAPPLLVGNSAVQHMKVGYSTGHSWIQSVKNHLALSPSKTAVTVGTETAEDLGSSKKAHLTVGDGHLKVTDKLTVGGSSGKGTLTETHMTFALGGGWEMTDTAYIKAIGDRPAYTKGAGKFMGNVGIGTLPKFPTFRLQVHIKESHAHGAVMVTDKADKGLTLGQSAEGALLRSWNIDTEKHEAMLVEAGPLLIQPKSGVVLFGTTVKMANMHLHVKGNLYIHGHMFAMKNLHVKDHAKLAKLHMPSMSLKNQPQNPDGDTLVLGHMKKAKKEGESDLAPWEDASKVKTQIEGINMRLGYHKDYTWVQVHGIKKGHHFPLVMNKLGNTVALGTVNPNKKYSMHANGNGYVLGKLYVKMNGQGGKAIENSEITSYSELSNSDAMDLLGEAKVQRTDEDLLSSRLTLIDVPQKLKASEHQDEGASVQKLTSMFHKVLEQQESHMTSQDALLKKQNAKILELQSRLAAARK